MRPTPPSLGTGLAFFACAGALALPLGCEETPPPVAPTTPVASVAAPTPPPAVAIELTPVAEPTDIFVVARWKNPNATLAGLGTCAGVPQTILDTRAHDLLDRAMAHAWRSGVDGRQLAEIVALDAPVDLVVSLDAGRRGQPDPLFAFSVGLTSLDRAQKALEAAGPLVELVPGLWRVGPRGSSELSCAIGPAAGQAPARLICGTGDKDVSALGPYLARNVPLAPAPAQDIHAEIRFTPVEARYGGQLRQGLAFLPGLARIQSIGDPRFDRALEDGAVALAEEGKALASDLDQLTLDLSVDSGSTCLKASGALQLRGRSSWLAGVMTERSDKQGPPPAIFWRAPVDSESASYSRAGDASAILRVLRGLLEGKLAHERIGTDADRKALAGLLTSPIAKDTAVVVASGHGNTAAQSSPLVPGERPSQQQIAEAITQSYLGWFLLGFDEGPAGLSKLLKDLVSVYGRKALLDPVRGLMGRDADSLPEVKLVPAPAQLGRGALDVQLRFDVGGKHDLDAKKKKNAGGVTVHILLMAEAKSTWIAAGANRDELVKRLLATKSGAPEAGTLAVRPGLEPLRSGKTLSSGFITVGTITRGIGNVLSSPLIPIGAASAPVAEIASTLNSLPHRGDTPIFLTSTATATGPRGEFVVNMSRGSFEDVGAILMTLNRLATNAGILRP